MSNMKNYDETALVPAGQSALSAPASYSDSDIGEFTQEDARVAKMSGRKEIRFEVGNTYYLRCLPPLKTWEVAKPFAPALVHWVDVPGKPKKMPVWCPELLTGGRCLVHEEIRRLKQSSNSLDHKRAKSMEVGTGWYFNFMLRGLEEAGACFGRINDKVMGKMMDICLNPKKGGNLFTLGATFDVILDVQMGSNGFPDTDVQIDVERGRQPIEKKEWVFTQTDLVLWQKEQLLTADELIRRLSGDQGGAQSAPPTRATIGHDMGRVIE